MCWREPPGMGSTPYRHVATATGSPIVEDSSAVDDFESGDRAPEDTTARTAKHSERGAQPKHVATFGWRVVKYSPQLFGYAHVECRLRVLRVRLHGCASGRNPRARHRRVGKHNAATTAHRQQRRGRVAILREECCVGGDAQEPGGA